MRVVEDDGTVAGYVYLDLELVKLFINGFLGKTPNQQMEGDQSADYS